MVVKRKRKNTKYPNQWMREKDLRSSMLFISIALIAICLLILYILAKVDLEGYVLIAYPVAYVFDLYKKAGPGGQLAFIQVPLFTVFGFLLRGWLPKK